MLGLVNRQISGRLGPSSANLASTLWRVSAIGNSPFARTIVSRAAKKVTTPPPPQVTNPLKNAPPLANCPPPAAPAVADPIKPAVSSQNATSPAPNRLLERAVGIFPKFMRQYARRVTAAPLSHITAFLVLHELTAIVPLFGLWGLFHYTGYTPLGIFPSWVIESGVGFIRRMAERNDWRLLLTAETGSVLVMQGAAAYAVVKATMPLRLMFSVWAMPSFAKWVVLPISSRFMATVRWLRPSAKRRVPPRS